MPSAKAPRKSAGGDDADELRKGLRGILAGGALGAFEETGVDPFDAPNEYDAAQRSGGSKRAVGGGAAAAPRSDERKPKSRRAQQEAARKPAPAADASSAPPDATAAAAAALEAAAAMGKAPKGVGKPQLPACASWWEEVAELPEGAAPPSADALAALRARADEAYTRECEAFGAARAKSHGASDRKLMQKLLTSGTQKDRVAALVVQAHESSFHSLPWVRQLVGLASDVLGFRSRCRVGKRGPLRPHGEARRRHVTVARTLLHTGACLVSRSFWRGGNSSTCRKLHIDIIEAPSCERRGGRRRGDGKIPTQRADQPLEFASAVTWADASACGQFRVKELRGAAPSDEVGLVLELEVRAPTHVSCPLGRSF